MAADGLLEDREDIFFLTWFDLVAFLRGEWDGQGGQRAQHSRWSALVPADVIISDVQGQPVSCAAAEKLNMNNALLSQATFSGKGEALRSIAASPGQPTDRVRICPHPHEGHHLQAGEVLVTPSTDPGWTPLFLRACAIVMKTGGYLSHGAIVAREFGIPAVVNISGLLERVKEGQLVTVDGSRGHIILGEQAHRDVQTSDI